MKSINRKQINKLLEEIKQDKQILALSLFGSTARKDDNKYSDIDVCLFMMPGTYSSKQMSRKRLDYLKHFDFDIQIFQQLPLYIKKRILKEGQILFCRNEDTLYNIAFKTIQEYSDYEHIYREYLKEISHAG